VVRVEDLAGARLAVTPATRRIGESTDYVVPSAQVGCIIGPVGVGKSTALRAVLDRRGTPTTWIDLPAVYTAKELIQSIYLDVVGDPEEFDQRDLQDDLVVELAGSGRVVVIANGERLSKEAAGQLEWLHSRSAGWGLYFVGLPTTLTRIATEPHLLAALVDTVELGPLSTTELHTVLPDIHDLFLGADRVLIDAIDKHLKGNLGLWMKFLHRALHIRALAEQAGRPVPSLDVDLARATLKGITATVKTGGRT
jgi:hypothetical protein